MFCFSIGSGRWLILAPEYSLSLVFINESNHSTSLKVSSLVDGMVGRFFNSVHHILQLVFLTGIQTQIPSSLMNKKHSDQQHDIVSEESGRILTYLCWVCRAVCFISAGKSPVMQSQTETCICNMNRARLLILATFSRTCIEIGWQAARVICREKQVDENVVSLLRREGFERWVMILTQPNAKLLALGEVIFFCDRI